MNKPLTDVRYLVVHCAATPPDMDIGAKEIDAWHRQRGFECIGYHQVIRRDGRVEAGRPINVQGAHALGFNSISLGVSLVGGCKRGEGGALVAENNFTPAQFAALAGVLRAWKQMYPNAKVLGHRDLPSESARLKDCPSFDVRSWLEANPLFTH
jgi:N-acetyl-anhydromuramyl-L-alanine amidase AmpD